MMVSSTTKRTYNLIKMLLLFTANPWSYRWDVLIVERLLAILKIHNPAADVNAFRTDIKKQT